MKVTTPDFKSKGPGKFLTEVRTELKKVTWPTREDTIKLTMVVVIISVIVAIFIGGIDALLLKLTAALF